MYCNFILALKNHLVPSEWPHLTFGVDKVKDKFLLWGYNMSDELVMDFENFYAKDFTTMYNKEKEGYQIVLLNLDREDYEEYGLPDWAEEVILQEIF